MPERRRSTHRHRTLAPWGRPQCLLRKSCPELSAVIWQQRHGGRDLLPSAALAQFLFDTVESRSEERRVGKECRSRCDWSSDVCSSDLSCPELSAVIWQQRHGGRDLLPSAALAQFLFDTVES